MRHSGRVSSVLRFTGAGCGLIIALCTAVNTVQAQPRPPLRRFRADSFFITEWVRGGAKEPDQFVEPREIAVTRDVVIVLDAGTREVHALDLRTGATRFRLEATGEGPGEFKRPTHIATTPRTVGVLDDVTSRLTVYSDSGRFLFTTVIPNGPNVEALCMLPRGGVRVKYVGAVGALATIDSTGRILSRTTLPVSPALQKAPSFANAAFVADGCADGVMTVAPGFGASWYRVEANGATKRFGYVEPGQDAVVTTKSQKMTGSGSAAGERIIQTTDVSAITRGAMQRADTIMIEAGETKTLPYQMIDYYRANDGAYLYSRHLPFTSTALAVTPQGVWLAAFIGKETSAVVRLSSTARPPRPKAKPKPRK